MSKLISKIKNVNLTGSTGALGYRRYQDNNTMKREFVFPLVVGVILGGLLMLFWQFNARLNNVAAGVSQLGQATTQNTQTVNDIVNFINGATGQNQNGQAPATNTPAAE